MPLPSLDFATLLYITLTYILFATLGNAEQHGMTGLEEYGARSLPAQGETCADPKFSETFACCYDDHVNAVCYYCGRQYDSLTLYHDCCYDGPGKSDDVRSFCELIFA
ncbi:hypothetical protein FOZ63_021358 [Perkinsus olseni]|uniref:Uncharacterized protein n=1 Tax=Perkinsus olseni TaxID=32597 RepID=A0A7J6QQY3_PEROL|nr:hypothetical protein FOZ60_004002 [Perkinsus olseni]KAF4710673.1 hypothetical protein FOZ62_012468 [Perkinsus olseni]KAF4747544.1 hypothetical protein FOZ63_021358 [Perkinsus olseni]